MRIGIAGSPVLWTVFAVVAVAMLALDLGVFYRKAHVVGVREAAVWSRSLSTSYSSFTCSSRRSEWRTCIGSLLFWGIIGGADVGYGDGVRGKLAALAVHLPDLRLRRGVLILTGEKMLARPAKEPHPEKGRAYRLVQRSSRRHPRPEEAASSSGRTAGCWRRLCSSRSS